MESDQVEIIECEEDRMGEWLELRKMLWSAGAEEDHLAEMQIILGQQDTQKVLLAVVDGRPVGFAEISIRPFVEDCRTDRVAYLEGWFVAPDLRRMGFGGELVRAAESWARAQGCEEMASDAELGNEVGLHAHLRLGFTETSRVVHLRKDLQ